ncbi:Acid-sensing ion channel 3 [Exaiptasia diaphana]|nr:Acid-sensing ion channel 3 [Exaiptasia diaphana]
MFDSYRHPLLSTNFLLLQSFGHCSGFLLCYELSMIVDKNELKRDNGEQLVSSTSNQKDLGLTLLLDIDNKEYYGYESYRSTGVKVAVHHQTEIPWVENSGNDIMPGFTTSIKITRKQVKRLPPPFRSACGSKKLVTSNVYTQRRCMIECFTRAMIKSRGCKILGMPNLPGFHHIGYCSPSEIRNDSSADELAKVRPNNCGCPIACKEITYTTVQSLAYFPSRSFMEMYANDTQNLNLALWEIRARFMTVVAYFEELNTEVSIEKPFYDINDFGSDLGGNLGLFLGCSVLTIMEFLDLLIMYCCQKLRSRNRTEQSNTDIEAG